MAGTVKIRHSIVIDTGVQTTNTRDSFVALVKALDYFETEGVCTRIASFYGEGAGHGFNFTDEALPCGENAFAVYQWPANLGRTWDWYMLIQMSTGATFGQAGTAGCPGKIKGATGSGNGNIGVSVASAFNMGGLSESPWRGTVGNIGADYKGSALGGGGAAVWVAPAGGKVFTWPRSNSTGGSFTSLKENTIPLREFSSGAGSLRWHVIADSDCLAIFMDDGELYTSNSAAGNLLIAPFTPLPDLTPTIPLIVVGTSVAGRPPLATDIGTTAGTSSVEGGVYSIPDDRVSICRISTRDYDAKNTIVAPFHQRNRQFNTERRNTELAIAAYVVESPNYGMVGYLDTFARITSYLPHCSVLANKVRVAFGDEQIDNSKWTYPWDMFTSDPTGTSTRNGISGLPA